MVDNSTSIEIVGEGSSYLHLRNNLKVDGRYLLDLPSDERIPTYEDINNTDPEKIDVISSYGMTLQGTDRNNLALRPFLDAAYGDTNGLGVDVYVMRGGERLPFTKMFVRKINDANNTIDVELQLGYDFWVERADNMPIYKIPFDPVLFTYDNVRDLNTDNYIYADGDNGITFPWVNYGRTYIKGTMMIYDLRPFVHLLALLRRGFKNINHAFSCPMLETEFGRHLACYFLKDDYGNSKANNDRRKLEVNVSEDVIVTFQEKLYNNVPFDNVVVDNGLTWNKITPPVFTDASYFRLGNGFIGTIEWQVTFLINSNAYYNLDKDIKTILWIEYPGRDTALKLYEETATTNIFVGNYVGVGTQTWKCTFNVSLPDMQIPPDSKIYVKIYYNLGDKNRFVLQKGSFLKITADQSIYNDGDTIDMFNELDRSISLLDVFRATSHFICGKVYYNYAINQVLLLSAFEAKFFEETVEGFFKSEGYEPIDITNVVPNSLIKTSGEELGRYWLTTGYARSTDPAITNYPELTNEVTQIFDSRNMVGLNGSLEEDRESRNPLFEPTINKPYSLYESYGNVDPELDRYPLDMPYLTDNEGTGGEQTYISFNIKPRILYLDGYKAIRNKISTSGGDLYVVPGSFMNFNDNAPMYAFDYPNAFNTDESPIDRYFAYGTYQNDLFTKFWKEYLRQQRNNIPYQFLAYVSQADNKRLDFRNRILINYMGTEILGRLTRKEDYDGGVSGRPVPLTFMPYRSLKQHTASDDEPLEERTECDTANLFIQIDEVDGCYTASLGGSSSSAISSVIFKYKLASDADYTLGDEICYPSEVVTFSMQVIFLDENCIDFFITQSIEPCQNEIKIVFTYNPLTQCLEISYDEDYITSTVDTETITYQLDGGAETPYVGAICDLEGVEVVTSKIVLTFEGGCDELEAELDYNFPPDSYDCDLNNPELAFTEVNTCQIIPLRGGDWITEITVLDVIQYKYNEGDDWQEWDGSTPLDRPVILSRVLVFEGCPSIVITLDIPA